MLDLFKDEAAEEAFNTWVHKTYGRKAGLLPHEYRVMFDERSDYELNIKAGKTVIIAIKYTPLHSKFKPVMRHIFEDFELRDFLRVPGALIRPREDGPPQWHEVGMSGVTEEPAKRNNVHSFESRYITMLEMTDKKTKRSVMVKIVGSAFDAQTEALNLLYGERGLDPAPLNPASLKAKRD